MSDKMTKCKACGAEIAKSAKSCPQCGAKNSKPITKKWWFWTIIALILIGGMGRNGSNNTSVKTTSQSTTKSEVTSIAATEKPNKTTSKPTNTSAPTNTPVPTNTPAPTNTPEPDIWIKGGTYKVGVDIEPGEYLVVATSWGCYIEVDKDSSGTFDSIISNETTTTRIYYTLKEGQYFKVQGGKFARADDVPPYEPVDGIYEEGMYKVGKDIPAGEYKITANESLCYIEVDKDSYNTFNSIVSNDNISLDESTYITLKTGQYIKFTGGQIVIKK